MRIHFVVGSHPGLWERIHEVCERPSHADGRARRPALRPACVPSHPASSLPEEAVYDTLRAISKAQGQGKMAAIETSPFWCRGRRGGGDPSRSQEMQPVNQLMLELSHLPAPQPAGQPRPLPEEEWVLSAHRCLEAQDCVLRVGPRATSQSACSGPPGPCGPHRAGCSDRVYGRRTLGADHRSVTGTVGWFGPSPPGILLPGARENSIVFQGLERLVLGTFSWSRQK